jgi:Rad3-related DNA helicase
MSGNNYFAAFTQATGLPSPFNYQCRLACDPGADSGKADTLRVGTVCQSQLIQIPTGCGKTAAAILAWLWNHFEQKRIV